MLKLLLLQQLPKQPCSSVTCNGGWLILARNVVPTSRICRRLHSTKSAWPPSTRRAARLIRATCHWKRQPPCRLLQRPCCKRPVVQPTQ